jgi:hypothetical protein
LHALSVDAGHTPVPSQSARATKRAPVHEALRHSTSFPGSAAQNALSWPSQLGAAHASVLLLAHAGRVVPCGAPFTGVHVPSEPTTLHASHCPVHAESQQYPSAQAPLPHSASVVHELPFFVRQTPSRPGTAHVPVGPQDATPQQTPSVQKSVAWHALPSAHFFPSPCTGTHAELDASQKYPGAQSAFTAHEVLHESTSQT